jgi:hypothetical protein
VLFDVAQMTTREVAFFFGLLMCISAGWSFIYFILVVDSRELSKKYKLFELAMEKSESKSISSETVDSNNITNMKEAKTEPATTSPPS